jgi:hypothetical protein
LASRGSPFLIVASFGGIVTTGVATLGFGFPSSFLMASGGSVALSVASFGGVAMIGVVLPAAHACFI